MKNHFPTDKFLAKQVPLALLVLAMATPGAFAQSYDTTALSSSASTTGSATASLGTNGSLGNTSYATGAAPNSAGLSGNVSSLTSQNTPMIMPPTGFGQLAPVFGGLTAATYGNQNLSINTPLGTIGLSSLNGGSIYGNIGGTSVGLSGLGTGVVGGNIGVGGTMINTGSIVGAGSVIGSDLSAAGF